MKAKIIVITISTLIVLPILYVGINELRYRAAHTGEVSPVVNNYLDSARIEKNDSLAK